MRFGHLAARGACELVCLAEPALLRILIAAAEKVLEATGNPTVLCSHLRQEYEAKTEGSA